MNKRYWQMEKITPQEIRQMFLTDEDRERIKRQGERAMRFISSAYGLALGMELESLMRIRA
jgi:hypothetical protein